jgi:hypothetical protein
MHCGVMQQGKSCVPLFSSIYQSGNQYAKSEGKECIGKLQARVVQSARPNKVCSALSNHGSPRFGSIQHFPMLPPFLRLISACPRQHGAGTSMGLLQASLFQLSSRQSHPWALPWQLERHLSRLRRGNNRPTHSESHELLNTDIERPLFIANSVAHWGLYLSMMSSLKILAPRILAAG